MRQSPHFTVVTLADGVFAAIAVNGGAAISNAGIIDLGDRTLIFDTFLTPQAARDLRVVAQELTGRDAGIIINSHYHNDHIWGNQVFSPSAHILSTHKTRELILSEGKNELTSARKTSAARLQAFQKQYKETQNEQERQDLLLWVGYYEALVNNLPALEVRLPDITFQDRLVIFGSARSVELIPFDASHTGNDAILHLQQESIIFAADLVFKDSHPYLGECELSKLLAALQEIGDMQATTLVPGHGPVGTSQDLASNMDYISMCFDTARSLVAAGDTTAERINEVELPARFSRWTLARFFALNLESLCTQIVGAQSNPSD